MPPKLLKNLQRISLKNPEVLKLLEKHDFLGDLTQASKDIIEESLKKQEVEKD